MIPAGSVAAQRGAGKRVACSGWTATQDPKDPLRLDEVRVKMWLRCGWLGARDPAGSAVVEMACAPVCEGKPQLGFCPPQKVPDE
jgi:hypothetical protein